MNKLREISFDMHGVHLNILILKQNLQVIRVFWPSDLQLLQSYTSLPLFPYSTNQNDHAVNLNLTLPLPNTNADLPPRLSSRNDVTLWPPLLLFLLHLLKPTPWWTATDGRQFPTPSPPMASAPTKVCQAVNASISHNAPLFLLHPPLLRPFATGANSSGSCARLSLRNCSNFPGNWWVLASCGRLWFYSTI
jgi:hypothetical protein